jgi:hypothetical protein
MVRPEKDHASVVLAGGSIQYHVGVDHEHAELLEISTAVICQNMLGEESNRDTDFRCVKDGWYACVARYCTVPLVMRCALG